MEIIEPVRTTTTEPRKEDVRRKAAVGGSAIEALAGVAAVVLSIIALSGMLAVPLASIAVIAAGAALLFEAGAVASEERHASEGERVLVRGGVGADAIAGLAAIVLGVLGLIGLEPLLLLPVAAIVLGAGLLLSAGTTAVEHGEHGVGHEHVAREARMATSGVHVLVGAGAAVLGILGVIGMSPVLLTLISTLAIGAAHLLSGATLGSRVASVLRHET
jgi:hypothetical protein